MATPEAPLKRTRDPDDIGRDSKVKRPHVNGHSNPPPPYRGAHDKQQARDRHDKPRQERGGRDGGHRERERERERERSSNLDSSRRARSRSRSRERDRGDERERRTDTRRASSRSRSPTQRKYSSPRRQRSPPRGPRGSRPGRRDTPGQRASVGGAPGSKDGNSMSGTSRASGDASARDPTGRDTSPMDEEEAAMARTMGFASFKTTKDTKVAGNDKLFAVRKEKKTEYRQYMNRVGGFNRPLSPSHS